MAVFDTNLTAGKIMDRGFLSSDGLFHYRSRGGVGKIVK